MIFFTADLHLGHRRQCIERRFKFIDEHDKFIIDRWNSVVKVSDIVYIIGDMIWSSVKDIDFYLSRLNGFKYLIFGDHDHKRIKKFCNDRFKVNESNIVETRYKDQIIIMSHWPQQHWRRSHYGSWHLYGHLHHGDVETGWGKRLQIGVDRWNYYPVSFDDVCEVMKLLPENPNLMRKNGN